MSGKRKAYPKPSSRSKWLAERERMQINASISQIPSKAPDQINDTLTNRIIKKLVPDFPVMETIIKNNWVKIAGEEIARHTNPGGFSNKTLCIYVKGSVWLAELRHNHTSNIMSRINEFCGSGTVKTITFKIDSLYGAEVASGKRWIRTSKNDGRHTEKN